LANFRTILIGVYSYSKYFGCHRRIGVVAVCKFGLKLAHTNVVARGFNSPR
jgi:hypothetical protein